jgi:hypothetical protein
LAKNQHTAKEKTFKRFLRGMSVHQKLGIILESKVVQKLSLEKNQENVFTKKWSLKLIFLNEFFFEKIQLIFYIKIDFESTILSLFDSLTDLKKIL